MVFNLIEGSSSTVRCSKCNKAMPKFRSKTHKCVTKYISIELAKQHIKAMNAKKKNRSKTPHIKECSA